MPYEYRSPLFSHVLDTLDDLMQDLTDLGLEAAADTLSNFYNDLELLNLMKKEGAK